MAAENLQGMHFELSANVVRFKTDMDRAAQVATNTATKINNQFGKITQGFGALGAALAFGKIIHEAAGAEAAFAQLQAGVRATGGAAGLTAKQLSDMAGALQKVSTFDDDTIAGAESLLLAYTKIGKTVFPQAQKAALDLATKMGGDLNSATKQVGKALEDPIHGLTALRKAGVMFTESQQEFIKSLVESGNQVKAQQVILQKLESTMGGAAEAARNTLGGSMKALENSFNNVLEAIGRAASTDLQSIFNGMANAMDFVSEHGRELANVLKGIAAAGTVLVAARIPATIGTIVSMAKSGLAAIGTGAGIATGGLSILAGVLVALKDETFTLQGRHVTLQNIMIATWESASKAVMNWWNSVKPVIDTFLQTIGLYMDQVGKALMKPFADFAKWFSSAFAALAKNPFFQTFMKSTPLGGLVKGFQDAQKWAAGLGTEMDKILKRAEDLSKPKKDAGGVGGGAMEIPGLPKEEEYKAQEFAMTKWIAQQQDANRLLQEELAGRKAKVPLIQAQLELEEKIGRQLLPFELEIVRQIVEERQKLSSAVLYENAIKGLQRQAEESELILHGEKERIPVIQFINQLIDQGVQLTEQQRGAIEDTFKKIRENQHLHQFGSMVEDLENANDKLNDQISLGEELAEIEAYRRQLKSDSAKYTDDEIDTLVALKRENKDLNRLLQQRKALEDSIKRDQERAKDIIKGLRTEQEKYNDQVAELNDLFQKGLLNPAQFQRAMDQINPQFQKLKDTAKEMASAFTSAFDSLIFKGEKFGDTMKDLGQNLLGILEKKLVLDPLEKAFGDLITQIGSGLGFGGGGGTGGGGTSGGATQGGGGVMGWIQRTLGLGGQPGNPGGTPGGKAGVTFVEILPNDFMREHLGGIFDEAHAIRLLLERCGCGGGGGGGGMAYKSPMYNAPFGNPLGGGSPFMQGGGPFGVPYQQGGIAGLMNGQNAYHNDAMRLSGIAGKRADLMEKLGLATQAAGYRHQEKDWQYWAGRGGYGAGAFGSGPQIMQTDESWRMLENPTGFQGFMPGGRASYGYDDGGGSGFRPGLVGGVNRTANYTPYNGGAYMPPQSGSLGPYAGWDAQGTFARGIPPSIAYGPQTGTENYRPKAPVWGVDYVDPGMQTGRGPGTDWYYSKSNPNGYWGPENWKSKQWDAANWNTNTWDPSNWMSPRGFAAGGRPPMGVPSMVGEKGPELFVPDAAGRIVPNDALGGGGETNIVINTPPGTNASSSKSGRTTTIDITGEMRKMIENIIASGGLDSSMRRRFNAPARGT